MDTFVPKGNISGPILPEFVLKLSITAGAKLMYSILCWHAYDKDYCWPSYANLASRMGCSINSIKNYFRELVKAKLVMIEKESYRSSKYFLLKPSGEVSMNCKTDGCMEKNDNSGNPILSKFDANPSKLDENPSNVGYLKNPNKQIQETPPPLVPNICNHAKPQNENAVGVGDSFPDFEKVYAAYPRKEAKGLAKSAWSQLARKNALPQLDVILAAIARFSASHNWQRENGRFIPHLSNFLKGERWNDPLTEAEIQEKTAKEESEKARRKLKQEEEERRIASEKKRAACKPLFDAFAAKFKGQFHLPLVFGKWIYLRDNGMAPLASDVPENNELGILDFLNSFERRQRALASSAIHQEQTHKQTTPSSDRSLKSPERTNCFRQKSPVSAGEVIQSVGEILKNNPIFIRLKSDSPKSLQAMAC